MFLTRIFFRSYLLWSLFCFSIVLHIFKFHVCFQLLLMIFFAKYVMIFPDKLLYSSSFLFLVYYFFVFLNFWRVYCIFMDKYFWSFRSFILLIHIYSRIILLSACKIKWWIYRPFILEWNFDLLIWNNVRLWNFFTEKLEFLLSYYKF